jgi:hypothetical protein
MTQIFNRETIGVSPSPVLGFIDFPQFFGGFFDCAGGLRDSGALLFQRSRVTARCCAESSYKSRCSALVFGTEAQKQKRNFWLISSIMPSRRFLKARGKVALWFRTDRPNLGSKHFF